MKYLYLILFNLIASQSFAQIQKIYLTKNGVSSSDPKKSNSYITIQKLDDDSAYLVKQYDMNDTIIMRGTYKDKSLEIPNGKFTYYNKRSGAMVEKMELINYYVTDTNNYIQTVGFFLNGKKVGTWVDYAAKGIKSAEYNYEDGKLEGTYKKYYNNYAGNWSVGTMVNNSLEGKVYMYNADGLLVSETDYLNNNSVKTTMHFEEAKTPDNYNEYLEEKLKKYQQQIHDAKPVFVKLKIDKAGEVSNPQIVRGVNPEIDSAFVNAFLTSKPYSPARYDQKPIEQVIFIPLLLFHEKENQRAVDAFSRKIQNGAKARKAMFTH